MNEVWTKTVSHKLNLWDAVGNSENLKQKAFFYYLWLVHKKGGKFEWKIWKKGAEVKREKPEEAFVTFHLKN